MSLPTFSPSHRLHSGCEHQAQKETCAHPAAVASWFQKKKSSHQPSCPLEPNWRPLIGRNCRQPSPTRQRQASRSRPCLGHQSLALLRHALAVTRKAPATIHLACFEASPGQPARPEPCPSSQHLREHDVQRIPEDRLHPKSFIGIPSMVTSAARMWTSVRNG